MPLVRWHSSRKSVLLASLLALSYMLMTGFSTTGFSTKAGAAALRQPYAPAGASGTGDNAPPVGSQPFNAKVWDAHNYSWVHHASSCPQPPSSVTARLSLVNSPTVLTYLGLPTLALESGNLIKWKHIVSGMQTHQCDWQINNSSNQLLVSDGSVSNDSGYGSTWTCTWYRGS